MKRCTFKKHRCTFVAKVRIQSCFIKNHIKWQIWMYLFSYFLKNLRESQLLKQKTPMGYGYISYFLSNRNTIFYEFSWLALHIPSPPACTEDIANRIAKDQYVQPNVPTTTILTVKKTILTMTPDHMYKAHRTTIHPVRLAYKPYFFRQRTLFFSHNKSANNTFSHGLSAKRTGHMSEGSWDT